MFEQLPVREAHLPQGTVRYRDVGDGPTLVFVHGLLVSGSLWRKVVPRLSGRYRCIIPDWPLGSHPVAMNPDADLSPPGIAAIVASFLEALALRNVTLVGNDSGGAICQLVAAARPSRLARLVLTTCDAFEVFPPPAFNYLKWLAHVPGAFFLLSKTMSLFPRLARLPIAFGKVAKHRLPDDVLAAWIAPGAADAGVRRDVTKFMRSLSSRFTIEAAEKLRRFDRPVLLAWTPEDTFFPLSLAHRLCDVLPNVTLELIDDSYVFVAEDQPERLASLIERFVPSVSVLAAAS
jgi:pimeloyl-ACP methyl ester carboxylesterase